jgi:hypothetical protein
MTFMVISIRVACRFIAYAKIALNLDIQLKVIAIE